VALVYRGNAGCDGCSEAVADLLKKDTKYGFKIVYVGPQEKVSVREGLKFQNVVLYVQSVGDGTVSTAYRSLKKDSPAIKNFVKNGGRYLGFCMGGYLADKFGFGVGADQYITSRGADVTDEADTMVKVSWRGNSRYMYFQDGAWFSGKGNVIAKYTNGKTAVMVKPYGKGKVGVSGVHPEADKTWGVQDPDGADADLGRDLINTLMK
jgi:glutamine amidotransferase-like uncharacterized protein